MVGLRPRAPGEPGAAVLDLRHARRDLELVEAVYASRAERREATRDGHRDDDRDVAGGARGGSGGRRPHGDVGDVQGRAARGLHVAEVLPQHRARRRARSRHRPLRSAGPRRDARGRRASSSSASCTPSSARCDRVLEDLRPRRGPAQVLRSRCSSPCSASRCRTRAAHHGGSGRGRGGASGVFCAFTARRASWAPPRCRWLVLLDRQRRRLDLGVRRRVEGRADRRLRDVQVLPQPRDRGELYAFADLAARRPAC